MFFGNILSKMGGGGGLGGLGNLMKMMPELQNMMAKLTKIRVEGIGHGKYPLNALYR